MQLPPGFMAILDAPSNIGRPGSFIGVVVQMFPVEKSRTDDFYRTIRIGSESYHFGDKQSGLRIKSFKKKEDQLPPIGAIGDLVVVRNIKVRMSLPV